MTEKNIKFRGSRIHTVPKSPPAGGSEITGTRGTYEQGVAYSKMLEEQERQHLEDMKEINKQLEDNRGGMGRK